MPVQGAFESSSKNTEEHSVYSERLQQNNRGLLGARGLTWQISWCPSEYISQKNTGNSVINREYGSETITAERIWNAVWQVVNKKHRKNQTFGVSLE